MQFEDGDVVDDGYFSICFNTNPYTYLGNRPFDIIPEATLDRGLAIVTFRSLALLSLLRAVASALGFGRDIRRHKHLDVRTDLTRILKTPGNPAQLESARGQLTPFLRDTLVGLNYAYYEPPGAEAAAAAGVAGLPLAVAAGPPLLVPLPEAEAGGGGELA